MNRSDLVLIDPEEAKKVIIKTNALNIDNKSAVTGKMQRNASKLIDKWLDENGIDSSGNLFRDTKIIKSGKEIKVTYGANYEVVTVITPKGQEDLMRCINKLIEMPESTIYRHELADVTTFGGAYAYPAIRTEIFCTVGGNRCRYRVKLRVALNIDGVLKQGVFESLKTCIHRQILFRLNSIGIGKDVTEHELEVAIMGDKGSWQSVRVSNMPILYQGLEFYDE